MRQGDKVMRFQIGTDRNGVRTGSDSLDPHHQPRFATNKCMDYNFPLNQAYNWGQFCESKVNRKATNTMLSIMMPE